MLESLLKNKTLKNILVTVSALGVLLAAKPAFSDNYNKTKTYASATCSPKEDANQDGKVGLADLTEVIDVILGYKQPTECSDVNKDGKVDVNDLTPIIDYILSPPVVPESIVGLDYGPFRDGQSPGNKYPTEQNFEQDMGILENTVNYARLYSTCNGFDKIIEKGKNHNISVVPAAWLSSDYTNNDNEINCLVSAANKYNVDAVIVGSEVTLSYEMGWGGLKEQELLGYISEVRQRIPSNTKVSTAEPWHIWEHHPELVNAVDFIFFNVFPYWEEISIENAGNFVREKYNLLKSAYPDKKIIISETGWPTDGPANGPAVPSLENHVRFIQNVVCWAKNNKVDFFFFEAFDEKWKSSSPPKPNSLKQNLRSYYFGSHYRKKGASSDSVGPNWGVYYSDRTPKHGFVDFLNLDCD